MSLENKDLFYLYYFTIILTRLTSTEMANYPSLPWNQIGRKTELKIRFVCSRSQQQIWPFHFDVLQRTTKKCTKI